MAGQPLDGDLRGYEDRVLVDVGCGPRPWGEHFPARLGFMVDCCMLGYREKGLLQSTTLERVCCIDAMAERLPFATGSVDILFAINMLDHTFDPGAVVREIHRVLKVGGAFHLHVDVGGAPNECEPIVFDEPALRALLSRFRPIHHAVELASNPGREYRVIAIMIKEEADGGEVKVDPREYLDVLRSPDTGKPLRREGETLRSGDSGPDYSIVNGIFDLRPRAQK